MAMGIVSDKDFEKEFTKVKTPLSEIPTTTAEVVDVNRGRPVDRLNTPDSIRKLVGDEAVINGRKSALKLGEMLGVSESSVSAYTNGSNSTATYKDQPNLEHINNSKVRVMTRARSKLMRAMHHLTDDKLSEAKARDLAGIARDMSAVVKNMEPETKGPQQTNNGPTFVFYSPQMRKEEVFDVVIAKE